jgi:cyclohexanone monooxygenase
VEGKFAHFVDDPYVEPGFTREPLTDEVDIVIIGGGFGGLLAGARFREAGLNNFRIIEAGGDFGGTWYWNRYPGAQCDIRGILLSASARRTRLHAEGKVLVRAGIYEHSQRIANAFNRTTQPPFQTKVTN